MYDNPTHPHLMATTPATVEYILDQLSSLKIVTTRKMFGEYALYYQDRIVGLVCDNTLFIKITEQGKRFTGQHYREGIAYPGAKPLLQINEDFLENRESLSELIRITAEHLPIPKKKSKNSPLSR